jgi:uncharacterized FlaG/YvyC family protein
MQVDSLGVSQPVASSPRPDPGEQPQDTKPATPVVSKEDVAAALAALAAHTSFKVEVTQDAKTGADVVRIYNHDGTQLLRQTPPEAVLEMARTLDRTGTSGLLASLV